MIIMIEAPGLPEKISAAGHWVQRHIDGNGVAQWLCSDGGAVQAIIDAYTPAEAAAHVCAQIDAYAKAEFNRHTENYSPAEMAGWPMMRAEALAWQADPMADVPNLTMEAADRGATVADIATRVLTNAAALQALRAGIMGIAGRHKDAVRALTTLSAITSYNWRTGWPA